jgi:hypothetical protein
MQNNWIERIKKYSKENNIPYNCAMYNKKFKVKSKKQEDKIINEELQLFICSTPIKTISNALIKLKFKEKIQTNKISLFNQIKTNFNTIEKIEKLIQTIKNE